MECYSTRTVGQSRTVLYKEIVQGGEGKVLISTFLLLLTLCGKLIMIDWGLDCGIAVLRKQSTYCTLSLEHTV